MKKFRFLRIVARIFTVLLILFILLVLFIRSPWGQGIIVDYATKYVSDKTNTKVEIEKLFITFGGNIMLKGLYLEDKKGDTLIFSKSLEAGIPLLPIIRGNGIGVDYLDWDGVRANIIREDSLNGYNFQFLIDAFSSADTTEVQTDSTSAPLKISLGEMNFSDFEIVFDDAVAGIDSQFKIGSLSLQMNKTDLEKMDFRASEISLTNSRIKFHQSPVPPTTQEDSPLPFLVLEQLFLKNVLVDYQSFGDSIAANLNIADLFLELPKADLKCNDIEIGEFSLKNSIVKINTETETNEITETAEEVAEEIEEDIQKFAWPEFKISIAEIDLQENKLGYFVGNNKVEKNVFNPNAISLQNFTLRATAIFLKDKKAGLALDALSFEEGSGLTLKEMALNLQATDNFAEITDLNLALNNNALEGMLRLDFPTLAHFIETPDQSKIDLNFPSFQIDFKEIFKFQPELAKNEYLKTLSKKYISGNIKASGYLSAIEIPNLNVRWGNTTRISATGSVQNATDTDNLRFNIPRFSASTERDDLIQFVSEKGLGVSLPQDVSIVGNAKGNLEDVYTKLNVTTSQGIATVEGHFENGERVSFDANVEIKQYNLKELLNNEQLGSLSLTLKTSGSGSDINSLDAVLDATISSFQFNDYALKDLAISGKIKNGKGDVVSKYKDENLHLDFTANVELDSVAPTASAHLDIIGANLQSLGLISRDVRTAFKLDADFEGNEDGFDVISTIGDGVVVYDNKTYLLGDVLATGHVRSDTTSIWLDNKMIALSLESNTDPATFGRAVQNHIGSYFSKKIVLPDTIQNPIQLNIKGQIVEAAVLNEVFLVNVQKLDTVKLEANFDESARKLSAKINAPEIIYAGNELDRLIFSMDTDKEKFVFDLGFNSLKAGPLEIPKTKITGNQQNERLTLNFNSVYKDSTLINVQAEITGTRERLRFHVLPDDLIFNRNQWQTPSENEIIISEDNLQFNDFRFAHNSQSVEFTDKLAAVSKNHVGIDFQNFDLREILNYLNPEEELAQGILNGQLIVVEPLGSPGILADLSVEKLNLLDVNMGTLSVDAESIGSNRYNFNLALKEGEVDLDLVGDYISAPTEAQLNLEMNINEFKMSALEGFSLGELKNGNGSFSGKFNVSGSTKAPQYNGNLLFSNASFTVSKLNAPFTLANEKLSIDNQGLYMDNFTVRDENNNQLVMSGKVGTERFINPTFDLKLEAENFQVLNATEDDNEFLYGTASFDANATLGGDLQIPKLSAKINVNNATDVTYVLPSATVAIEERDGVIIFVNRKDPDAILTRTEQKTTKFSGFDINALLNIGREAKVTIIIDKETGDNFEVYGDGDFDFTMKPNGSMSLSGVYEIGGGHYEMNLYNLVNRRFELAPGSRVSWSGDPFDAALNVRAIYEVEASASPLMAPVISGSDPAVKNKYRQVLPFYVYLNVDGELTKPIVTFDIDMPEDEQGAIGGQVYGRLQQITKQEGELNRQVFSLLVLNRFYPEPGSDGSRGGFATVARDNLNDALSDQLNTFSDKLLGDTGVELDFGLDSYTDYQGETPQERTQLDIAAQKKLFSDRVIVRVGSEVDLQGSSSSNEPVPLIGNVSLEYLLTENGRYRLVGFRRNEFESVIDGQTIVSGIALIFTQEFNKFDELWQAILRGETEKEKADRKEAREKMKEKKQSDKLEEEQDKINEVEAEKPKE